MIAQFVARTAAPRLAGLILMDTTHGPLDNLDPDLIDAAVSIVRAQGISALADIMAEQEGPLTTPAHRRLLAEQPGYAEFNDRKLRATSPGLHAAMAPLFPVAADRIDSLRQQPGALPGQCCIGRSVRMQGRDDGDDRLVRWSW